MDFSPGLQTYVDTNWPFTKQSNCVSNKKTLDVVWSGQYLSIHKSWNAMLGFILLVKVSSFRFILLCDSYGANGQFVPCHTISSFCPLGKLLNNIEESNEPRGKTRLADDRVKPWLTKMINSSLSNTMIRIGNLDLRHLIDTLNYLATPTPKSSRFLITFSWIM